MTGLISAEYVKIRKRGFFWVTAGLIWVLSALVAWISVETTGGEAGANGSGVLVGLGELVALILAIQILGGKFAGGRWAAGLTRDARRGAHLVAKTVTAWVGLLCILVISMLVSQLTFAVFGAGAGALGEVLEQLAKSMGIGLVWIMIAFPLSALFRAVGVSYIVGFIFINADSIASLWDKYQPIAISHNTSAFLASEGGVPVLLGWGGGAAVASWALLRNRDA